MIYIFQNVDAAVVWLELLNERISLDLYRNDSRKKDVSSFGGPSHDGLLVG